MATAQSASRISELAALIRLKTDKLDTYFSSNGLPPLSFDHDFAQGTLPLDVEEARDAILQATDEMHDLMLGPRQLAEGMPIRVRRSYSFFDCLVSR